MDKFNINWVLINEIAISPAPYTLEHFRLIEEKKISTILCLCNEKEYSSKIYEEQSQLAIIRKPLPDHRESKLPEFRDLEEIILLIENLIKDGPILIHCLYAIERSPIICLIWLVYSQKIDFNDALDYLMSVHKKTNPLNSQINHAKKFIQLKKNKN